MLLNEYLIKNYFKNSIFIAKLSATTYIVFLAFRPPYLAI